MRYIVVAFFLAIVGCQTASEIEYVKLGLKYPEIAIPNATSTAILFYTQQAFTRSIEINSKKEWDERFRNHTIIKDTPNVLIIKSQNPDAFARATGYVKLIMTVKPKPQDVAEKEEYRAMNKLLRGAGFTEIKKAGETVNVLHMDLRFVQNAGSLGENEVDIYEAGSVNTESFVVGYQQILELIWKPYLALK